MPRPAAKDLAAANVKSIEGRFCHGHSDIFLWIGAISFVGFVA